MPRWKRYPSEKPLVERRVPPAVVMPSDALKLDFPGTQIFPSGATVIEYPVCSVLDDPIVTLPVELNVVSIAPAAVNRTTNMSRITCPLPETFAFRSPPIRTLPSPSTATDFTEYE